VFLLWLEEEEDFSFFNIYIFYHSKKKVLGCLFFKILGFLFFYEFVGFVTTWMVGKGVMYIKLRKEIQRNSSYNLATCFIKTSV
jgi:hypothetical protein